VLGRRLLVLGRGPLVLGRRLLVLGRRLLVVPGTPGLWFSDLHWSGSVNS